MRSVTRVASALEAHLALRNVLLALTAVSEKASVHSALLVLTAVMDRKNAQNALKDPSALRERQFQQNVNLDHMLQLAQQRVSNVMRGASALMEKYKNVQLAPTVTLGSQSVHHVHLEISVSVD